MKFTPFIALSYSTLLLAGILAPFVIPPVATANELTIAQAQPDNRRRIAVLDFDFASTGLTAANLGIFGAVGPAQGVSDLVTNKLVQDGTYIMIERSRILAVLQEQNLAQAERLDPGTAAQIGRILGADAVLIGSITRFNLEEGRSGTSILGIGGRNRRSSAEVSLTARLVNTTTAEILAAVEGSGTAEQRGRGFSVGGLFTTDSDTDNTDTLLSNAAEDAANQLTSQLVAQASRLAALPPTLPQVEAVVADVAGNQVVINKGSRDGFRVGMNLSIERVTRQVTDPETGRVLRTLTSPVGRIELTDVDAESSVGRVVNGNGFRVGDRAIAVQ